MGCLLIGDYKHLLWCLSFPIIKHPVEKGCGSLSQLHRSLKEFNKKLIAVTSFLDAVVAGINALCAMVNQF